MTGSFENDLARRLMALGSPVSDGDWLDVERRARRLAGPPVRRSATRIAAVAAAVALTTIAVPQALGVSSPLLQVADDLFGDDEVKQFQEAHPDRDVSPQHFGVTARSRSLVGRVWSDEVKTLEVVFPDGRAEVVRRDDQGRFVYRLPPGPEPNSVIARGVDGKVLDSAPVPPPFPQDEDGSGD